MLKAKYSSHKFVFYMKLINKPKPIAYAKFYSNSNSYPF